MKQYIVTVFNRFNTDDRRNITISAKNTDEAERLALSGGLINRESGWGVLESREVLLAEPGSVSHGTMRNEDLFPIFLKLLFELDRKAYREFLKEHIDLARALCDKECGIPTDWWTSEEASCTMNEDLFSVMEEYAPKWHYFGAHPGNGSDYGYWPCDMDDAYPENDFPENPDWDLEAESNRCEQEYFNK